MLFHSVRGLMCSCRSSCTSGEGCLIVPGSQGALDILDALVFLTGSLATLAGHHLTGGCLLSLGGLIWKGVELPERQKLEVSSAVDALVAQQALWVLVHSARKCVVITAEAPSRRS